MGQARSWAVAGALLLAAACSGGRAQAACSLGRLAEFPVRIENRRAVVEVTLNGAPRRMMLDSGAFFSSIDAATVRELHLPLRKETDFEIIGVGGVVKMGATSVKTFTIAGTSLGAADFLVNPSPIESFAGLLGHNVLLIGDVEYDFGSGAVRLMRPKDCSKDAELAYWTGFGAAAVLPIRPSSKEAPHTIGTVYVNGVPVRAVFDTGAPFSALTRGAAARAGVKLGGAGVEPAGEVSGIGPHRSPSWIARFDSFRIGGEEVKNARLRIADVGLADTEMLIGADFFLSHRIYVSDSRQRMWLTYQGGPVFDLTKASEATDPTKLTDPDAPKDAEGLSRRATGLADRQQYALAIVDLTEAIRLAPTQGRYLRQRANLWVGLKRYGDMAKDYEAAIVLDPKDAEALTGRAAARLLQEDTPAALRDLKAAEGVVPAGDDMRLMLASYALRLGEFDDALVQADAWIKAHPESGPKLGRALDQRCEARGMANRELDAALADCDRGLKLLPGDVSLLEDRALVRYRRGELERVRADVAQALKLSPGRPLATYLHGLLAIRGGDRVAGEADLAAAIASDPGEAAEFKRAGLAP